MLRSILRARGAALLSVIGMALCASSAQAVNVQITPTSSPLLGYMNVFQLPANGGGYMFGSGWGVQDLRANFTGNVLKLEAAPIGTADAYWYQNGTGGPGAAGNKNMDASVYIEDNSLAGQSVTFSGNVLENTLVSPYTSVAFIKDFAPDYSSVVTQTVPLTPGAFSITMQTINDPARHVQYGFETIGPNVWPTDVASKGYVTLNNVVPEPTTLAAAAAAATLVARRRRA